MVKANVETADVISLADKRQAKAVPAAKPVELQVSDDRSLVAGVKLMRLFTKLTPEQQDSLIEQAKAFFEANEA
ncbi:MAG: hypothetical protein DI585_02435 [Pseudomonas fluorescens]|nr:MAG: hypothetical protein DI585_02435 [Pseudomonas fluorescens]